MARQEIKQRRNRKLEKMLDTIRRDQSFVKVGILASGQGNKKSSAPKEEFDENGKLVKDQKITNVDVAMFHEFGTSHIPQRSFLRSTYDAQFKNFEKVNTKLLERQLRRDKFDKDLFYNLVGLWFVGKVKKTFSDQGNRAVRWERLSDATLAKRKMRKRLNTFFTGHKALIDTGQLRASIIHEVVEQEIPRSVAGPIFGQVNQ